MTRSIISALAAALCGAFVALPAAAQQTPPKPCSAEVFRAFDFWLGDWEVFTTGADGKEVKAGDNSITSAENGCLLIERWTGASGTTGQSYNFVDHGTGKWRQLWVSPGTVIDYEGGLDDDGAMTLTGEIAYGNGVTAPFKGVWTRQDDGSVKQHFQQYDAEKDVWNDWFIGIYKKKK